MQSAKIYLWETFCHWHFSYVSSSNVRQVLLNWVGRLLSTVTWDSFQIRPIYKTVQITERCETAFTARQLDTCDQASQVQPWHNLWCKACLNNPHHQHNSIGSFNISSHAWRWTELFPGLLHSRRRHAVTMTTVFVRLWSLARTDHLSIHSRQSRIHSFQRRSMERPASSCHSCAVTRSLQTAP